MSMVLPEAHFATLAEAVIESRKRLRRGPVTDCDVVRIDGRDIESLLDDAAEFLYRMAGTEPAARRALSGLKVSS